MNSIDFEIERIRIIIGYLMIAEQKHIVNWIEIRRITMLWRQHKFHSLQISLPVDKGSLVKDQQARLPSNMVIFFLLCVTLPPSICLLICCHTTQ